MAPWGLREKLHARDSKPPGGQLSTFVHKICTGESRANLALIFCSFILIYEQTAQFRFSALLFQTALPPRRFDRAPLPIAFRMRLFKRT